MQTKSKLKGYFLLYESNHLDIKNLKKKKNNNNYNLLVDVHIGCLKLIHFVNACEVESALT